MTKPIIKEVNATTGEEIEREMTDKEFVNWTIMNDADIQIQTTEAAKAADKAALLDRLGITAEEAKLLLS